MLTLLVIAVILLVIVSTVLGLLVRRLLASNDESESKEHSIVAQLRKAVNAPDDLLRALNAAEAVRLENDRLELELSNALRGPERESDDDVPYHRVVAGVTELAQRASSWGTGEPEVSVSVSNPFSVLEHEDWRRAVELWRSHGSTLIDSLDPRSCPACNGDDHRELFRSYDGYPFHECRDCGTWFVPRHVDSQLFSRFFEAHPEARAVAEEIVEQRTAPGREQADRDRFEKYLEFLKPLVDASGSDRRYLDIGCGLGHSLGAARDLGYDARGIEVDEQSVRIARANGHEVGLPGSETVSGEFGLVALWETLEHLDRAREIVEEAVRSLRPSGVLALTFPNLDNPGARILRSDCIWIHGGIVTPGHINLFNERTITRMLDDLGLEIVDVSSQYGTNLHELVLYTLGRHRGVEDHLQGDDSTCAIPERLNTLLSSIAPTWSLVERSHNLAPILQVIACRKGEHGLLEPALDRIRETRREELQRELSARMPGGVPLP